MTIYDLSRDKRVTVTALILEVLSVLSLVVLLNALLGDQFGLQTAIFKNLTWQKCLVAVLALQYLLVGLELLARYREETRGWTLPLVFLPMGHVLRFALILALALIVIVFKLLVYFVSVVLSFVFLLTRTNKFMGTAHLVDTVDRLLEPLETFVNRTYNALYFNKIRTNGGVFNAFFNGSLVFWCINH